MKTAVLFALLLAAALLQARQPSLPPNSARIAALQKAAVPSIARGLSDAEEYRDPEGVYAGFTVCADCSGIAVRLQLTDAQGSEDHGTYARTRLYLDAPVNGYRGPDRDQLDAEHGRWKLTPAETADANPELCLYPAGTAASTPVSKLDCYHIVHQAELVSIDGFEEAGKPDPFPAGLKTLLKMRRLSNGHEYPLLPVDGAPFAPLAERTLH